MGELNPLTALVCVRTLGSAVLNLSSLGTFQTGLRCSTTAGCTVAVTPSTSAIGFDVHRRADLGCAAGSEPLEAAHEQCPHIGRDCASGVAPTRKLSRLVKRLDRLATLSNGEQPKLQP